MKKLFLVLIALFGILFTNDVYAGNAGDEAFLQVGEKYVIEQQEGVVAACTSENEEIATVEAQVITGVSPGETYIVITNEDNTEKRLHVFVGDYKLCIGQEKPMEFNLSSVINAWDSSANSSNTSVVKVTKQGYENNYADFLFEAVSRGMTNITISSRSSVLESFTMVVQEHALVYCEQTEPTCSQKGSVAHYECLFCGQYFRDSDGQEVLDDISIDETDHDYVLTDMEEATCSENGYAEYVCRSCQHTVTQRLPGGHIYEAKEVQPDCISQGYTAYTCSRCGNSYKDSYVDARGHNYTAAAYINNNSIVQKKCTICGNAAYEMNINGMMIDQTFYPRRWDAELFDYYVPLNQECSITSSCDSPVSTGVSIKYKRPLRDSEGKLKIYDIKMIYKDIATDQVRYDNAVNCITFSYGDDYTGEKPKALASAGVSQCELKMDYDEYDAEIDDDEIDEDLFYTYHSSASIGNKQYSILGVTFKLKFESNDSSPYNKIPMQDVELSNRKLKIAKGFSKKLKVVYDSQSEYKVGSLKWRSSNRKIATVNSSGKVKAKKTGKCTITCRLSNGKTAKCKITVVKNEYKGKSLAKCNARKESYGNIRFEVNKAYYSGNNFVLQCVVMNARILKAEKFNWITVTATDTNGRVIAKKRFDNVPINLGAYGKRYITFTFPKSAVKKKRELHQGVWMYKTKFSCQYSH